MIRRLLKPGDRGPTARELSKLIADSTSARNVRASNGVVQQRRGGTIMHPRFQPITEFTGRIEDDDEYSTDARYRVVQLFAANHEEGTWNKHVEFKDLGEGLHVVATNMVEYRPDDKKSETHDIEVGTIVKVYALLDVTEPQRMNRWVFWFGGGGTVVQQFKVKFQNDDTLDCRTWDGEKEGNDNIFIAKPYLLRTTPFDGQTRNDVTYGYRKPWERVATIIDREKPPEDWRTEVQVIVPSYVTRDPDVGSDIIYATLEVIGGTGVTIGKEPNEIKITVLDDNRDGRAWTRKFNP